MLLVTDSRRRTRGCAGVSCSRRGGRRSGSPVSNGRGCGPGSSWFVRRATLRGACPPAPQHSIHPPPPWPRCFASAPTSSSARLPRWRPDERDLEGPGEPPRQRRLSVRSPVVAASGHREPGEHPPAVCPARARDRSGLARRPDPRDRLRSRPVRRVGRRARGIPATRRRGGPRPRGHRARSRGLPSRTQLHRLAPPPGDLRPHRDPDPRRRRSV